jgi:hypothetical protein
LGRDRAGRVEDIRVVADVEHVVPVSWEGGIILKNSIFATKLHMVRGDRSTVQLLGGVLKIAQRLRLDPSKVLFATCLCSWFRICQYKLLTCS